MPEQLIDLKAYNQALFSSGQQLVVIYFSKSDASSMEDLRTEFPNHRFFSVNIDHARAVADQCKLDSSRAFKLFMNGSEIKSIDIKFGDGRDDLRAALSAVKIDPLER